jgi:proliferating cell nuclear antigen
LGRIGVVLLEFPVGAAGDTDDVRFELPTTERHSLETGAAETTVSLSSYLGGINRAVPAGEAVTLALGTERPVELAFGFADGAGSVGYLVAPRTPIDR